MQASGSHAGQPFWHASCLCRQALCLVAAATRLRPNAQHGMASAVLEYRVFGVPPLPAAHLPVGPAVRARVNAGGQPQREDALARVHQAVQPAASWQRRDQGGVQRVVIQRPRLRPQQCSPDLGRRVSMVPATTNNPVPNDPIIHAHALALRILLPQVQVALCPSPPCAHIPQSSHVH